MNTSYTINTEHGILVMREDNVNLIIDNYNIDLPGIYMVRYGSTGNQLVFPSASMQNGEIIIVSNSQYEDFLPVELGGDVPYIGNSSTYYSEISAGQTVEFISDGFHWRSVEKKIVAIDTVDDGFNIESPGFYVLKDDLVNPTITLPYPSDFNDEQITIFAAKINTSSFLTINAKDGRTDIVDITGNSSSDYFLDPYGLTTFTSVNGYWRLTESYYNI